MNTSSVAEIVTALREIGFPPRFQAHEARLVVQVMRLVADGRPVSQIKIEEIASDFSLPFDAATFLLTRVSEYDETGNIVGILGLSQRIHPHRFTVNNQSLSTSCAWDALFLPVLLGQTTEVESTCPTTKAKIRIRITPQSVEEIHPAESVVTIVLPKQPSTGFESAETIWKIFCCFVHFIASEESAMAWSSANQHDLNVLSVEDGYELGRVTFKHVARFAEHQGADL